MLTTNVCSYKNNRKVKVPQIKKATSVLTTTYRINRFLQCTPVIVIVVHSQYQAQKVDKPSLNTLMLVKYLLPPEMQTHWNK